MERRRWTTVMWYSSLSLYYVTYKNKILHDLKTFDGTQWFLIETKSLFPPTFLGMTIPL